MFHPFPDPVLVLQLFNLALNLATQILFDEMHNSERIDISLKQSEASRKPFLLWFRHNLLLSESMAFLMFLRKVILSVQVQKFTMCKNYNLADNGRGSPAAAGGDGYLTFLILIVTV